MPEDINLPEMPSPYSEAGSYVGFARRDLVNYARAAVLADREQHALDLSGLLGLLADIRSAVGDPEGRLMQPELLERIRGLADREGRQPIYGYHIVSEATGNGVAFCPADHAEEITAFMMAYPGTTIVPVIRAPARAQRAKGDADA